MPAHSKRPSPPARMVELLAIEKRRLVAERQTITRRDFDAAWNAAWAVMVSERGWPHATTERRAWRTAMLATRSEARAAFMDDPTPFALAVARLTEAAKSMCVWLEPGDIPKALLGAIAYVETPASDSDVATAA